MQSAFGPLVLAGIFAATLSSALAALVSAPKVFQAVCRDKLLPYIDWFAVGYGKGKEPRRAYVLALLIAMGVILIGDLNTIAPIISNFFLAAYTITNVATFHATLAKFPGFRPSFKYYNIWTSFFGAVITFVMMFVLAWWTALITVFCVALLYLYVLYRKPEVNWGGSIQAQAFREALKSMTKLAQTEEHVKTYRPNTLVLSGNPLFRPSLIAFAANITKRNSLLICGDVIIQDSVGRIDSQVLRDQRHTEKLMQQAKIKGFYCPVVASSFRDGVQSLIQLSGLGRFRPNILMLGFKNNWQTCDISELDEYLDVIQYAVYFN